MTDARGKQPRRHDELHVDEVDQVDADLADADLADIDVLDALTRVLPLDAQAASAAAARRFDQKVVRGPADRDCWIWTGAISDDGYGRFWVSHNPPRVAAAHRVAYELVSGPLADGEIVEHAVCDNPICVRYEDNPSTDHLLRSTQAANLARMGQLGRGGGAWTTYRWRNTDRASTAARSRRLREAVRGGWSYERITQALADITPDQPGLW